MKKASLFTSFILALLSISCIPLKNNRIYYSFNQKNAVKDNGSKSINNTNAEEISKKMITGWNLGNTFDATASFNLDSETSWGCPYVTKQMIVSLKNSGINTIRIPISWSNHIIDGNYSIDPLWMQRIKQVVDYAIDEQMYVIINSHHDNLESKEKASKYGYYPNKENLDNSLSFITNIWKQISLAFNNGYDEHLIFEAMNEPRLSGTSMEWTSKDYNSLCKEGFECLNKLNQAFVNTVRSSGGNNEKRILIIPTLHAGADSALCNSFIMPSDKYTDKMMLSVHMYIPYSFAMQTPGDIEFTDNHKTEITETFKKLFNKYSVNGIPVFIGEYGVTNKGNDSERIKWFEFYLSEAKKYNFVACLWDNYQFEPSETEGERYGYFIRDKGEWYSKEILDTILKNTK